MSLEVPDQEHVKALRKSAQCVGFLHEIIVDADKPTDILGGKHRVLADENWTRKPTKVESPLHREIIMVHDNVQKQVSQDVTAHRLLRIAHLLSTTGGMVNGKMVEPVAKEDVCQRLTDPDFPLVPFSPDLVRKYLPEEYKKVEFKHPREEQPIGSQIPREDLTDKQKELLEVFDDNPEPEGKTTAKEPLRLEEITLPSPKCKCPTCDDYHTCYS